MKGKKGPACYGSTEGDRGIPKGKLPKVSEKKAGPICWAGQGGNKGIPKSKPGRGSTSGYAAMHD